MIKLKPRKIVSMNYSFLITLPPVWLNHHKLGKKSYVALLIGDKGELILKPLKK